MMEEGRKQRNIVRLIRTGQSHPSETQMYQLEAGSISVQSVSASTVCLIYR